MQDIRQRCATLASRLILCALRALREIIVSHSKVPRRQSVSIVGCRCRDRLLFRDCPPQRPRNQAESDWSAWQRIWPVLEEGRIMPVDSFARARVEDLRRVNPSIGNGYSLAEGTGRALGGRAREVDQENRPRALAAELLRLDIEPEKWDDVPFLYAAAELRSDWLGVPLVGEDGNRLTRVTPRQLEGAKKFHELVEAVRRSNKRLKKRTPAQLTALQQSAKDLAEAFILYERLRFDPARGATAAAGWAAR